MPGPKAAVTAPPLDLSGLPEDRAEARIRFIAEYVIVPRGHGAGDPLVLRPWQEDIVRRAYAPGVRTALTSLPRGNGRSALAAALAVAELFVGPANGQVLVVASDERQARIIFDLASQMIQKNPLLSERVQVFRDKLVAPHTGTVMYPLPASYDALQGFDPTLQIVDELHVVTDDVWEALSTAVGKRPESLTLAISTPGSSRDTVMWRLVEHGRSGEDPSFSLTEFAGPDGCAIDDRAAWRAANPALGDFLSEDSMLSAMRTTREPRFRQLRLAQWVSGVDSWLPFGMFEALANTKRVVDPAEKVVLAFDGSASGDSTALVGCTIDDPHLFVVQVWANPGDARWRVPRGEVAEAVREAFQEFSVLELACDPWGWRSEIEEWAKELGKRKVVEYNTGAHSRMAPATDRIYQAIAEGTVSHDGSETLEAHFRNAVAKSTSVGDVITKDKRNSPRKIDAAVCAIVAFDRAAHHRKKKRGRTAAF